MSHTAERGWGCSAGSMASNYRQTEKKTVIISLQTLVYCDTQASKAERRPKKRRPKKLSSSLAHHPLRTLGTSGRASKAGLMTSFSPVGAGCTRDLETVSGSLAARCGGGGGGGGGSRATSGWKAGGGIPPPSPPWLPSLPSPPPPPPPPASLPQLCAAT